MVEIRSLKLRDLLENAINKEALKLIVRHQKYLKKQWDEATRISKRRAAAIPPNDLHYPDYWDADDGFNPYKVRKRAPNIAYAIAKALKSGHYKPRPAVKYQVPKGGGQMRDVSAFQVADSAVSRIIYKTLLKKNTTRLSSSCYAYRDDLTLHDAVKDISESIRGKNRVFVAEYDFSKFFDSISHTHIDKVLRNPRFYITERERELLWSFISAGKHDHNSYTLDHEPRPTQGIPQGTSISLFVANLVAYQLDHTLEGMHVRFARYADDTVIWSESYSELCDAVSALDQQARRMGVKVNLSKSDGISLMVPQGAPSELQSKNAVSFIGYSLSTHHISMKSEVVERAKRHIAALVYRNLLQAPKAGICNRDRLPLWVDLDYLVMQQQVRRYLYGELSESKLARYMVGEIPRIHFHGLMSFYPIVDDDDLLSSLDGWLAHTVYTTLRKRRALFAAAGVANTPPPHNYTKHDMIGLEVVSPGGRTLDLHLPSFLRISRLLRLAAEHHGPSAIAHPDSGKYYSFV